MIGFCSGGAARGFCSSGAKPGCSYGATKNIFSKKFLTGPRLVFYKRRFRANDPSQVRGEVSQMITSFIHREQTVKRQPSARMRAAGLGLGLSSLPTNRYIKF